MQKSFNNVMGTDDGKHRVGVLGENDECGWECKPGREVFGVDTFADGQIAVAECTNTQVSILGAKGKKTISFNIQFLYRILILIQH